MADQNKFFDGVLQQEFQSNDGRFKFKLPIFYYDNTSISCVFTGASKLVKKYLPHKELFPLEIMPGRCLIVLSAFEYRKTDIGPYNEFAISVLVNFGKNILPGLKRIFNLSQILRRIYNVYIWHLPVTTEIARYGGVEFYNYPKFIADIKFKEEGNFLRCTLYEKGKHILTLKGKKLETKRGRVFKIKTYSFKNNHPLVTNIHINPIELGETFLQRSCVLELGKEHPIAEQLREINLGKTPIMYQYMPKTEAILFPPRNVIDW